MFRRIIDMLRRLWYQFTGGSSYRYNNYPSQGYGYRDHDRYDSDEHRVPQYGPGYYQRPPQYTEDGRYYQPGYGNMPPQQGYYPPAGYGRQPYPYQPGYPQQYTYPPQQGGMNPWVAGGLGAAAGGVVGYGLGQAMADGQLLPDAPQIDNAGQMANDAFSSANVGGFDGGNFDGGNFDGGNFDGGGFDGGFDGGSFDGGSFDSGDDAGGDF